MNEFDPAQLVEHTFDGASSRYSLILDPFGPVHTATSPVFEPHGLEAGGYGWRRVVEALVRMRAPEVADRVKYDPESSMFAAYGNDRDALLRIAELIRAVQADPGLLAEAIIHADPDLLD